MASASDSSPQCKYGGPPPLLFNETTQENKVLCAMLCPTYRDEDGTLQDMHRSHGTKLADAMILKLADKRDEEVSLLLDTRTAPDEWTEKFQTVIEEYVSTKSRKLLAFPSKVSELCDAASGPACSFTASKPWYAEYRITHTFCPRWVFETNPVDSRPKSKYRFDTEPQVFVERLEKVEQGDTTSVRIKKRPTVFRVLTSSIVTKEDDKQETTGQMTERAVKDWMRDLLKHVAEHELKPAGVAGLTNNQFEEFVRIAASRTLDISPSEVRLKAEDELVSIRQSGSESAFWESQSVRETSSKLIVELHCMPGIKE